MKDSTTRSGSLQAGRNRSTSPWRRREAGRKTRRKTNELNSMDQSRAGAFRAEPNTGSTRRPLWVIATEASTSINLALTYSVLPSLGVGGVTQRSGRDEPRGAL